MTPTGFIAKWRANARNERAAAQEHFLDLCALLDEPTPNSDPTGAAYAFEKGATKASGGEDRLAENFPLAVEHLLTPDEFRREVLLDLMEPINGVSAGYHHLADFMLRGLVWTILTTNFDPCLPRALQAKQPHMKRVAEVNRGRDDFAEFSVFERRQVVWLHVRAEQYTDRNLRDEVAHLGDALVSRLRPLVDDSPLIVIGYRGAEPSVMEDLLTAGIASSQNYPRGIYWCVRRGDSLHPNVERLARAIGRNFHLLEIDGFD